MTWQQTVNARKAKKAPKPSTNGNHKNGASPAAQEAKPVTLDVVSDEPFPEEPSPEAFHGLAGQLVDAIDPHTEASRVAILIQTLATFGNIIGPVAHWRVEDTKHHLNLFAVLVGKTAKARKGTSWNRVLSFFCQLDNDWAKNRIVGGMSSGEGLIWEVRDSVVKLQPITDRDRPGGFEEVEIDPGITDKRLFVQEAEFAAALKQSDRSGNILSAILRQAWESGCIRTLSKNSPARATGAHISIIGHITAEELRRYLSSTESASGFGNRFLWVAVTRSKFLPEGGLYCNLDPLVKPFAEAIAFARCVNEMPRDEEASAMWNDVYRDLEGDRPGLVGALTARAGAQTMRMACIYALLDCCYQVELPHLRAALALWRYCERSTAFVFGHSTGDQVADDILAALRKNPEGLARAVIFSSFSNHQTKARIERALSLLQVSGLAKMHTEQTSGRPKEVWKYGKA